MAQENTKIIKENMNGEYMIRTSILMAKGEENETIKKAQNWLVRYGEVNVKPKVDTIIEI